MERKFDVMYYDYNHNKHLICGISAAELNIIREEFDVISCIAV